MTDLTAARTNLTTAEAALAAASRDAQDAQARFYAAWQARERARAVVAEMTMAKVGGA